MSEINEIEEIPAVTFPINLKLIQKYQRLEPRKLAKYKHSTYHKGSFRGGNNSDLNLIMCKNKKCIPSKLPSYVLHSYHVYPLHSGMYRTQAIICQHLYWPDIIIAIRKEVTNCDTCQRKNDQI